jgi:hypothetical protein
MTECGYVQLGSQKKGWFILTNLMLIDKPKMVQNSGPLISARGENKG